MDEIPQVRQIEIRDLLIRLDERTTQIQKDVVNFRMELKKAEDITTTRFEEVAERLDNAEKERKSGFESIRKELGENYVKKEAFLPVQKVVYGLVGLVLTAVATAIIGLVLVK